MSNLGSNIHRDIIDTLQQKFKELGYTILGDHSIGGNVDYYGVADLIIQKQSKKIFIELELSYSNTKPAIKKKKYFCLEHDCGFVVYGLKGDDLILSDVVNISHEEFFDCRCMCTSQQTLTVRPERDSKKTVIKKTLKEHPEGITVSSLSRLTKINYSTVYHYIHYRMLNEVVALRTTTGPHDKNVIIFYGLK